MQRGTYDIVRLDLPQLPQSPNLFFPFIFQQSSIPLFSIHARILILFANASLCFHNYISSVLHPTLPKHKLLTPSEKKIAVASSIRTKMASGSWDPDREFHESLVSSASTVDAADRAHKVHLEEIRTTPLFRADVLAAAMLFQLRIKHPDPNLLPQYGFLAKILRTFGGQDRHDRENILTAESSKIEQDDSRLFVNVNAPWSAFICGSQGSGKSHTLSCMLETALNPSRLGKLPRPLAGMIFHYDKFTGFSSSQICEAAYLSSTGIPVRVLVSPSNMSRMRKAYENLPGIPSNAKKPVVAPLLLQEKHLNVDRMMKLMAIDGTDGKTPLYMEVRISELNYGSS